MIDRIFPASAVAAKLVSAILVAYSIHPAHAQTPDTVVAQVNGEHITFGEIKQFQESIPSAAELDTKTVLPQLIDFYINQKLVIDAALNRGLDNDPAVKSQLEQLKAELIRQAYLREEISVRVSQNAIEEAYAKMLETAVQEPQAKARHILVASQNEAEEILKKISDGADFGELARDLSLGPSGSEGGDLGWFAAGTMVPEFSQTVFALKAGEVSPTPVNTEFGWHIIKVEGRRLAPIPTLDEIREQLTEELTGEAVNTIMVELRSQAKVNITTLP